MFYSRAKICHLLSFKAITYFRKILIKIDSYTPCTSRFSLLCLKQTRHLWLYGLATKKRFFRDVLNKQTLVLMKENGFQSSNKIANAIHLLAEVMWSLNESIKRSGSGLLIWTLNAETSRLFNCVFSRVFIQTLDYITPLYEKSALLCMFNSKMFYCRYPMKFDPEGYRGKVLVVIVFCLHSL